ncbi:Dynactin subunit 5 [Diplonema papillatum]|nr:Dynactin subunit 5 [Diplonema papillatum]
MASPGEAAAGDEEDIPPPHLIETEPDVACGILPDVIEPPELSTAQQYKVTSRSSKVSTQSVLCGLKKITMKECCIIKKEAVLRADLAHIFLGSYCILGQRSVIRPHWRTTGGKVSFFPIKIGSHVYVGDGSIVEAASIGSCVLIGEHAVVGRKASIKSGVVIEPNTVVPADAILPSFTRWGGDPAVITGFLHEGAMSDIATFCKHQFSKVIVE